MGEHIPDLIDANLERILNAAGSSLRHYMPSSKDKLRKVMGEIEAENRATIAALVGALEVLLDEATSFNVSGVYFDEECMGHKGPDLARAALLLARGSKGDE